MRSQNTLQGWCSPCLRAFLSTCFPTPPLTTACLLESPSSWYMCVTFILFVSRPLNCFMVYAKSVRSLPRFLIYISGGEVSGPFWGLCPWYEECELFGVCVPVWKVPEVFWCPRVWELWEVHRSLWPEYENCELTDYLWIIMWILWTFCQLLARVWGLQALCALCPMMWHPWASGICFRWWGLILFHCQPELHGITGTTYFHLHFSS